MTTEDSCCQRLQPGARSPFELSVTGYHDGPLTGWARCRACGRTYHFEMVTWDDMQEVRVYAFARVTEEAYQKVRAIDSLPPPSLAELHEAMKALTLAEAEALQGVPERTLFVASVNLHQSILAAREMSVQVWESVLGFSWVSTER